MESTEEEKKRKFDDDNNVVVKEEKRCKLDNIIVEIPKEEEEEKENKNESKEEEEEKKEEKKNNKVSTLKRFICAPNGDWYGGSVDFWEKQNELMETTNKIIEDEFKNKGYFSIGEFSERFDKKVREKDKNYIEPTALISDLIKKNKFGNLSEIELNKENSIPLEKEIKLFCFKCKKSFKQIYKLICEKSIGHYICAKCFNHAYHNMKDGCPVDQSLMYSIDEFKYI
jgi:hypothetical protein